MYEIVQYLNARLVRSEKGQTMAEYAVVLAVITLAILAALGLLATNIGNTLSSVANKL
jgi:Flp pilus assembly pilin Flp